MDPKADPKAMIEKTNAAAMDAVAATFKGLPGAPVAPEKYDLLSNAANAALTKLSGSMAPPEFQLPPAGREPFAGFQPGAAMGLAALKVALDKVPEGEPYRFEVSELESDGGFVDVADRLQRASADEALARKLTGPGMPPAAPKAKPAEKQAEAKVQDPVAFTSDATNDHATAYFSRRIRLRTQ